MNNTKTFTLEQMLDVLNNMQKALNPWLYKSSKDLGPEDYVDLAHSLAHQLGISKEFDEWEAKDPNFIESYLNNNGTN